MKFNFKIQQYQTDAVDAVVRVFQGQGFHDKISYIRDRGKVNAEPYQMTLGMSDEELEVIDPLNDTGYKNEAVELSDEQLLHNIQTLQNQNNIKLSASLVKDLGRCSLDGNRHGQNLCLYQDDVRAEQEVRLEQVHRGRSLYCDP